MTAIPVPPVGARVRHTSTYADGTTLIAEGIVAEAGEESLTGRLFVALGSGRCVGYLVDLPGVSVSLEVLEEPYPPEPADGYYLDRDGDLWRRRDGDDPGWYQGSDGGAYAWVELNRAWGPLVRLVPDPADGAPALPWTAPHEHGELVVDRNPHAGESLLFNGKGISANKIRELMAICARHLRPGAERDELLRAARQREARRV